MFPICDGIRSFEQAVADFAGAPYGVAVDTGYDAIFLSCKYFNVRNVKLPKKTCVAVPSAVLHAGAEIEFVELSWKGTYPLAPYPIVDSACRFRAGMYQQGTLWCLSFQYLKALPIGRGGMILTDNQTAYEWLKRARFFGRPEEKGSEPEFLGWSCIMEPERAIRGLSLMLGIREDAPMPDLEFDYPDCSRMKVFHPQKYLL